MRRLLRRLLLLTWSLWFGGLLTLFLLVTTLFKSARPVALEAAPRMFTTFERYQLFLAAAALVLTVAWRLLEPRLLLTAIFILFAISAASAAVSAGLITPKLEALRVAGESSSPQFKLLHGQSMMLYSANVILLLIAGLLLPTPTRVTHQTTPETAPASASPAEPALQSP